MVAPVVGCQSGFLTQLLSLGFVELCQSIGMKTVVIPVDPDTPICENLLGFLDFFHCLSCPTQEDPMPKSNIHPTWYPEAKVYCNGEVVMTVGSTKPELHVDVWSGNHPFYTGTQKIIDTEGRVERFLRKYGMLDEQQ
jgi:large subunit ribosomal protein L31